MTLAEFFKYLGNNSQFVLIYFGLLLFTAILAGVMGKDEGHLSPWKYLYSGLVYLVAIPGISAITLSIYLFLFERRSIFDTNMVTQILPIFAMIITFLVIKNNVNLKNVPGFGKISGLITIIFVVISMMILIDKTHIIVFSYIPIQQVLIAFVIMLVAIRWGWSKLM